MAGEPARGRERLPASSPKRAVATGERAPEVAAAAAAALSFPAFPCAAPVTTRRYASPRSGAPDLPTLRGDAPAGPALSQARKRRLREAPRRGERPTAAPVHGRARSWRWAEGESSRRPERPDVGEPDAATRGRGDPHLGDSRGARPGAVRCGGAAELGEMSFAAPASLPPLRASPVENKTRKRQKVFVGALPGPRGRRPRAGVNPP